MNHPLSISLQLFRMFSPVPPFLIRVRWIGIVRLTAQVLGRRDSVVNPRWPTNEVLHVSSCDLLHLRHYLNARRSIPNHSNSLVAVVKVMVPVSGVSNMSLEVMETGNLWPFVVTVY